jgi:hypothetical protein
MTELERLKTLANKIESGTTLSPRRVLNVDKRVFRLESFELGGWLSESSWALLDLLATLRPRYFGRGADVDGILCAKHRISNAITAENARREFQRQLPCGLKAALFVETVYGKGYRLHPHVKVPGSEAGLNFMDQAGLKRVEGRNSRVDDYADYSNSRET